MNLTKKYTFLILLFSLTSCHLINCDLDADLEPLTAKPSVESVKGTWYPDKRTMESVSVYRKSENPEFIISSDGTFKMSRIPAKTFTLLPSKNPSEKSVDATGTWKLVESRGFVFLALNIDFKENTFGLSGLLYSFQIKTKNESMVLFENIGDPDECEAVRLIKK